VEGFRVLSEDSRRTLSPMTVLVERQGGAPTDQDIALAAARLKTVNGVAAVVPTRQVSTDGQIRVVDVVLKGDPNDVSSLDLVPKLRGAVANLRPGVTALVAAGRPSTTTTTRRPRGSEADRPACAAGDGDHPRDPVAGDHRAARPARQRCPLVRLPLGISILFIRFVVGDAGFDASIPTFAFIFLVALGIDYTIFLNGPRTRGGA